MSAEPEPPKDPPPADPPHDDRPFGARLSQAVAGPPGWLAGAPVAKALLWSNILIFVGEVIRAQKGGALVEVPSRVMMAMGANYAAATMGDGRFETLLTSCFLHFSLLHIVFNMYALRQIGPPIERNIGSGRLAPMYLLSGIVGSGASTAMGWLSGQERLSAGASGAICGIIGAALVLGLRAQGWRSPLAWAMARWLGLLLAIQVVTLVLGQPAPFDNSAHFGGALTGALFAASWRRGPPYGVTAQRAIFIVSSLAVIGAFAMVAWRDTHDPFALLRADERYAAARALLQAGQCGPAADAIEATARLAPRAPEVLGLRQDFAAVCKGGML